MDQLEKIKEKSLELLSDFDQFCKENDLTYNIAFGTLLGAIRHQGFIPWDDDIDVDMYIEDYVKLEKLWNERGNKEKYFFQTKKNDPNISSTFYRLRMNNTTSMDKIGLKVPMHWGIPLDIFPYYNAPKSKAGRYIMEQTYRLSQRISGYNHKHPNGSKILRKATTTATMILTDLLYLFSKMVGESQEIFFACGYTDRTQYCSRDVLLPVTTIKFEDLTLMAPNKPVAYLEWQYDDFRTLPPEEKRVGHPTWIVDVEHDYKDYLEGRLECPRDTE